MKAFQDVFMRKVVSLPLLLIFAFSVSAQKAKPTPTKKPSTARTNLVKPSGTTKIDPAAEKADLERAIAVTDPAERIKALQKFLTSYPKSESKNQALELITSARAALADDLLGAGKPEEGIKMFKLAVTEAPEPIPDKLFDGIIANFPTNLFLQRQPKAANEVAKLIEERSGTNANRLLTMAGFFLGIEDGEEAKRLAEKAIQADPQSKSAYQTLGLAYRMNFQPQESADAYAKALELDPASTISRRSLAETKRSLGKPEEAASLYREILAASADDASARTGLILSLFDAGKKAEAESEMAKALETNPEDLPLISGAAYWYAANNNGEKAIELAKKAIEIEPRYIWSHIALARGHMALKKPLDAERVLLSARQYGNFPTLEYEIASARLMAGFFFEAGEELKKSFAVDGGLVETYLGGRVQRKAKSFLELVGYERRASIFQPLAADNAENSDKLEALLDLTQVLEDKEPNEAAAIAIADEFISGDDNMKFHRQMYAANALLKRRIGGAKVLEIMGSATATSDRALDVASAAAATMADQLYDSRQLSMSRNQLVIVPDVPRQTLTSIIRGKIEDTTGAAMLQQGQSANAEIRFKRALSVLPEKSAWWRATMWHLGAAQAAEGKDKEALESYIGSYSIDKPDGLRYLLVESLYKKVHGNTDGLQEKIGPNPVQIEEKPAPAETPKVEPTPAALPADVPAKPQEKPADEAKPAEAEAKPVATPEVKPEPTPEVKAEPTPEKTPDTPAETKTVADVPAFVEKPAEVKTEPVTEEKKVEAREEPKAGDKPAATPAKDKPLFDPVVITVGKTEEKPAEKPAEKPEEKPEAEKDNSGAERPRVVEEKPAEEQPKPCTVSFTQETISLLNNGGSIGILASIEGDGDIKQMKATSSSPDDVGIYADTAIGGSRKAFFVIRSISTKTGKFTLTFEGPCGKLEMPVVVR